ncbi:hypothetical protein MRX96_037727 [Rhipicephalus microplus]
MEDESVCIGVVEEGGSLDVTADHAALINTLSSSVVDCAAEHTVAEAEKAALNRTLDTLRVQLQPAAAGNSDHPYRVCLWLCAATTVLCFAALVAAAVTVTFKSSDELSRSFGELERALKGEGAATAGAVPDPSTTRTAPSNRTTQTGGIALDVSKRPLNRTDFVFQAD